nr:hypothetical protein [Escherichia coli]
MFPDAGREADSQERGYQWSNYREYRHAQ